VTDLQDEVIEDSVRPKAKPQTVIRWLAGGLAIALLAVIGLAAWVYSDHHQTAARLAGTQAAAVASVEAYIKVMNSIPTGFVPMVRRGTLDFRFTEIRPGGSVHDPMTEPAFLLLLRGDGMSPPSSVHEVGQPVVTGEAVISVPLQITSTDPLLAGTGTAVFVVRDEAGQLKVWQIVWIPGPGSM
jgi:hypothetical protein